MEWAAVTGALASAVAVLLGIATVTALLPMGDGARRAVYALAAAACAAMLGLAVIGLTGSAPTELRFGDVLGFALVDIRLDRLGSLFVAMLAVVGAAASVYAIGYTAPGPHVGQGGEDDDTVGRPFDPTLAAYPIFLGSLLLVFGAADSVSFLIAWEGMALSSAVLVVGGRPTPAQARAGYVYLVLTHLASAALILAFAMLAGAAGGTGLDRLVVTAHNLPPGERDLLFVLLLVGFATKAGAVPLHVWLPRAHPVAPSHVSALMSGVMVKAGVYGVVRFVVAMLGTGPEWWGVVVLALGAASAVMGVLYALMEHDLKRLLAFSTIENVGIILLGVGAAMLAGASGLTAVAALALGAALLHALNHAAIKGLLFLAAGSVQHAAGSRDLNRLGGLAHVLPMTTMAFGLGAAAMAGLPVLNGFAGEWLTFQGLLGLGSAGFASPLARTAALLGAGALGLAAALALAAFVKATGTGFLALPRSEGAAAAREGGRTMGVGMGVLALACVAGGLAAGPLVAGVTELASRINGTGALPVTWSVGAVGIGGSGYGPIPLALVLGLVFVLVWAAGSRGRAVRRAPTWTCGIVPEPAFEYTSTSFGKLIRLYFGRVLLPEREVSVELHPGTPFPRTVRYRGGARHVIDERLYLPLQRGAVAAAQLARRVQNGSLQLYLAYTVLTLVLLLLVARP